MKYDNPRSMLRLVQVGPLRKAPSVCKVCVFIDGAWQLLVTARVSLLGEPGAVCFIAHSLMVSFFQRRPLLCPTPDCTERPTACPPTWQGHNNLWCYSERCSAYGLTLSVIWSSVLIMVSGALIPERNGLSQFNNLEHKWTLCACPRHCDLLTVV